MSLGKMGKWTVVVPAKVEKKIKKLQPKQQRLILQTFRDLETNPDDLDFYQLKGRSEWRLRVGLWRMLFRVDKGKLVMVAFTIKPGGDAYK
jgi:mRNA interferase RelE/StbE